MRQKNKNKYLPTINAHKLYQIASVLCLPAQVRWKSKKSDLTNGGYTQEMIRSLFEKVLYLL